MTTWNGDMSATHTIQDEYEYASEQGWASWTTDEDGFMAEDKETIKSIDMTPTWSALLPGLLDVVRNGETVEARKDVEDELRKMATAADFWNHYAKLFPEQAAELVRRINEGEV